MNGRSTISPRTALERNGFCGSRASSLNLLGKNGRFMNPSPISLPKAFTVRCACDPSGFFTLSADWKKLHPYFEGRIIQRNKAGEFLVSLSRHFHPRNHFLSDVTTLLIIDAALFQIGFNGEGSPPSARDPNAERPVRFEKSRPGPGRKTEWLLRVVERFHRGLTRPSIHRGQARRNDSPK